LPFIESVTTERSNNNEHIPYNITFTRILRCQCQSGNPKRLSTRYVQGCPLTNEIISDGENELRPRLWPIFTQKS